MMLHSSIQNVIQDIRYGLRQLRRSPGFTTSVLIVLALGIGANAAMFTVLEGTLLRRLPYGAAERLVVLSAQNEKEESTGNNLLDVDAWRQRSRTLEEIAVCDTSSVNFSSWLDNGTTEQEINETHASGNLFHVLGVAPSLGRGFTTEEQQPGNGGIVVLSDTVWRTQFHAATDVLGKVVRINGEPVKVVGVMPPGFVFPAYPTKAQVWRPLELNEKLKERGDGVKYYLAIARRRNGVSVARVDEELSGIQGQLSSLYASLLSNAMAPSRVNAMDYRASLSKDQRTALLALMVAVGIVWLIACVNVANLMLARSTARRREMAVRGALGASRGRLVQQLVVESLLLSLGGSALGILLARETLMAFRHALTTEISPGFRFEPDGRVLVALLGLSLVSVLLFGVAPALLAARMPLDQSLRQDGAHASMGGGQQRVQQSLVVVEIGLSLAMLVACGLLLRTVFALRHAPLGFRTDHVYVVQPKLPGYKYRVLDANEALYKPLLERVQRMHGVETAAITTVAPLDKGFHVTFSMYVGNGDDEAKFTDKVTATLKAVGPELQKVLGFEMAEGRFFNEQDTADSQPVVVVNEAFVKRYRPAMGSIMSMFNVRLGKGRQAQVVGVMKDFHQKDIEEPAMPEIDVCTRQLRPTDSFYKPTLGMHAELGIRATRDAKSLVPDLLRVMHEVSPDLNASSVESMDELVADSMGSQLLAAHLLEALGILAMLVSLAGLYSLLAYLVTLRTRELGLRMALGARREQILGLVMRQAGLMIVGGIVMGIGMSLATTQLLKHFLFGVKAWDVATIAGATALMAVVAAMAAYLPARRAARIAPMEALRTE
jgi:predicted permease